MKSDDSEQVEPDGGRESSDELLDRMAAALTQMEGIEKEDIINLRHELSNRDDPFETLDAVGNHLSEEQQQELVDALIPEEQQEDLALAYILVELGEALDPDKFKEGQ